jgi:hypothetical protein
MVRAVDGCDVTAAAEGILDALRSRQADNRAAHTTATDRPGSVLPEVSEHLGLPALVVPFNAADDGRRPLEGRPSRFAPLRSSGLTVTEPGTGDEVDRLRPETTYELTARIRNVGDADVPPTIVEFFADHRPFELEFDTTGGVIRLPSGAEQTITGLTTLRPGSQLEFALEYQRGTAGGYSASYVGSEVGPDRTFELDVEFDGFEMYNPATDTLSISTLPDRQFEAEIVVSDGPITDRGPLPLSAVTADAEFVGMRRERIPAGRTAEVSIEYTTPPKTDHVLGTFYVRAYSLMPLDAPKRWSILDHRTDRHVGRTEVHWE